MIEDAALLRDYATQGREEAFTAFVRRHVDLVYAVAVRRTNGDTQLAEEVAQTVFTSAARKAATLAKHQAITAWLFTSARYAAGAAMRSKQRRIQREHEAGVMDDLHREVAEPDWEKLRPVLDEAIDALNERERVAVLLRFYHARSFAEIGAELRISGDAARMRVERALERLARAMNRRGVRSTAGALAMALANQVMAAPPGLAGTVAVKATLTAAAGVSPGVALIQFMGSTKVSTGLALVALTATATFATREAQACRHLEHELTAANQDLAVVESSLQNAKQRADSAERRVAEALTATEVAQSDLSSRNGRGAGNAASNRSAADPRALGNDFLQRHPEVRRALENRARAHIATLFGAHYKEWGLSPEKIQQFETLMLERESIGAMGADDAMMYLSLGVGLSSEELDKRVHALLGEDAYWQYRAAKDLAPIRQRLMDLAGALYYTDTPLTSQQMSQLSQLIEETHRSRMPSAIKWSAAVGQAKRLLQPDQAVVVDDIMAKRAFNQAVSEALRRSAPPAPSKPSS